MRHAPQVRGVLATDPHRQILIGWGSISHRPATATVGKPTQRGVAATKSEARNPKIEIHPPEAGFARLGWVYVRPLEGIKPSPKGVFSR